MSTSMRSNQMILTFGAMSLLVFFFGLVYAHPYHWTDERSCQAGPLEGFDDWHGGPRVEDSEILFTLHERNRPEAVTAWWPGKRYKLKGSFWREMEFWLFTTRGLLSKVNETHEIEINCRGRSAMSWEGAEPTKTFEIDWRPNAECEPVTFDITLSMAVADVYRHANITLPCSNTSSPIPMSPPPASPAQVPESPEQRAEDSPPSPVGAPFRPETISKSPPTSAATRGRTLETGAVACGVFFMTAHMLL